MATESVKILIEAEDKATAALQKTAREAEVAAAKFEKVKNEQLQQLEYERILLQQGAEAADAYKLSLQGLDAQTAALIAKEKALIAEQKRLNADMGKTGEGFKNTKASTEFFGSIANLAGGNAIGSAAAQLAGLTEKTAQFNEVAKQGGVAAAAFKLGIVAATAAIAVQVGQAIGSWAFETQKWNTELDLAIKKSDQLATRLASVQSQDFSDTLARIGTMGSDQQDAAIQTESERIKKELAGIATQAAEADKAFKDLQEWQGLDWSFELSTGKDLQVELSAAQKEIERVESVRAALQGQVTQLDRKLTIEKELEELRQSQAGENYISGLQDQLADLNADLAGTTNQLQAMVNTVDGQQSSKALGLLDDIDAVKKQIADREKQKQREQQDVDKAEQQAQSLAQLKQRELDKLEEERILLEKGKEAAHAFRLEKQGLSSGDAANIASVQAELDRINDERNAKAKDAKIQPLQAQESRLLTRGPEQDKTAENTKKIADLSKEQLVKLENIYKRLEPKEKTGTTLELVSK